MAGSTNLLMIAGTSWAFERSEIKFKGCDELRLKALEPTNYDII